MNVRFQKTEPSGEKIYSYLLSYLIVEITDFLFSYVYLWNYKQILAPLLAKTLKCAETSSYLNFIFFFYNCLFTLTVDKGKSPVSISQSEGNGILDFLP